VGFAWFGQLFSVFVNAARALRFQAIKSTGLLTGGGGSAIQWVGRVEKIESLVRQIPVPAPP
jgi:hypothetical protein